MKFVINSCNYFNYSCSHRSLLIYGVSVIASLKRESWVKLIIFFIKGTFSYILMTAQINLMMRYYMIYLVMIYLIILVILYYQFNPINCRDDNMFGIYAISVY